MVDIHKILMPNFKYVSRIYLSTLTLFCVISKHCSPWSNAKIPQSHGPKYILRNLLIVIIRTVSSFICPIQLIKSGVISKMFVNTGPPREHTWTTQSGTNKTNKKTKYPVQVCWELGGNKNVNYLGVPVDWDEKRWSKCFMLTKAIQTNKIPSKLNSITCLTSPNKWS